MAFTVRGRLRLSGGQFQRLASRQINLQLGSQVGNALKARSRNQGMLPNPGIRSPFC